MPELKIYDLFISHAWRYNDDYTRLVDMLRKAPNFNWRNYSDPKHDPVVDPDDKVNRDRLVRELEGQIRPTNCVIVISGMYVAYRYWIQKEIDIAASYGKRIIGVIPWGQERTPQEVQDVAAMMVAWNTDSIVSAIRG